MKRNFKSNVVVAVVLLLLIGITIGYASINSTLNINGTTDISSNSWDIHFDNVEVTSGSVAATTAAAIQTDKTQVKFGVDLDLPGDFYEFTVDVVNAGSLDAMINDAVKSGLSTAQEVYTSYIVTYENGDEIKKCDQLAAGETKTLKVRVEYRKDITAEQLPTTAQSLELNFEAQYIQYNASCTV